MQKIKKVFLYLLTIGLPWLTLIIIEEPIPAFFVFFLQLSFIGWIPGSIWAFILLKKHIKHLKETEVSTDAPNE
jgi:hypothetical protein